MKNDTLAPACIAGVTITMADVMAAGHCPSGARRWFHEHGLDFHAFMESGIDAAAFIAAGDDIARQIVQYTLENAKRDGQA